jgi:tetratricopeptide (TPR) repeat protein
LARSQKKRSTVLGKSVDFTAVVEESLGLLAVNVAETAAPRIPEKPRPSMDNSLHDDFVQAFRRHQAGDLTAAAVLYESVLARDAHHADACHLLGVLRHQQGQSALAVELIGKAVAMRPSVSAFHANLAEVYRAVGQFERAVGCCRTALQLQRDNPEALNNLGLALGSLGRAAEAAEQFRAVLALRPDDALAHSNLGTALRSLGQTELALEHFRRAVALDPKLGQARSNLGQLLLDLGRAGEALPHCREAVVLQPGLAQRHNNVGNVHRAAGRYAEARACYFEALRLNPSLARTLANLGQTSQQEGRMDEALVWYRRAIELKPNSIEFLGYLADAAADWDRQLEAIECYKRIVELDPNRALSHNNLGALLQEEGRLDEAKEHYHTALRVEPNFPLPHISLGGLLEAMGELPEAEARFRKALELHPGHTVALARLATLLKGDLPDDDLRILKRRLADPTLDEPRRSSLLFGLAHVLDAHREYDEAGDCLRLANALALADLKRRHHAFQPAEHQRFISNMIAAFLPADFARFAGVGSTTRRPVFVFGLPRSGTTLIEQVLSSHSQVHGAGELRLGRQDFEAIPSFLNRSDPAMVCLPDLTADAVRRMAQRHDDRLRELGGPAQRVVDKMPDNYMYLGLLAILFPNACFIHCRRDLRDVAVSCWINSFRGITWSNDPAHIAARFREYERVMDHWRAVLPSPIHEVDYEETVENLEHVARRLVAACGLDWEPACLDFHLTRRPVRTASVVQVRQPLYKNSVARWKNYERKLAGLFEALPASSVQPS